MEKVGNMKLYSLDEVKDELIGRLGTAERDEYELEVEEALNAYYVGEAIKKARIKQNITQEELGKRIGVKRSQICKLESGKSSITLSTMSRVFKALGFGEATLDLGKGVRVALW